jgi:hypothetical protein
MEIEMSTATQLKKVATAITGLTSAVSNTFVESAGIIAAACHDAFGGSLDIDAADITRIQDNVSDNASWKGTSSEGARRSEVKAIVLAYTGLETAAKTFRREFGELRREHFVKLAREIPQCETPTDAGLLVAEFFETRGSNASKSQTPAQKLAAGMTQAINNVGDNGALKRALYNLCKKHSITIK